MSEEQPNKPRLPFTMEERQQIQDMRRKGFSIAEIARKIGRSVSSTHIEYYRRRNPDTGIYDAKAAHDTATRGINRLRMGRRAWMFRDYEKRKMLEEGVKAGKTNAELAAEFNCSYDCIVRELRRGGGVDYSADYREKAIPGARKIESETNNLDLQEIREQIATLQMQVETLTEIFKSKQKTGVI